MLPTPLDRPLASTSVIPACAMMTAIDTIAVTPRLDAAILRIVS